jgi:hypothetical protein
LGASTAGDAFSLRIIFTNEHPANPEHYSPVVQGQDDPRIFLTLLSIPLQWRTYGERNGTLSCKSREIPNRFGGHTEFANSLCRSVSFERKMRPTLVVFCLPAFEFSGQISSVVKLPASVELFGIGLVAAFHLAIDFGASGRNVAMRDDQVRNMPGKLWAERRVVVGLNPLDSKGEMFSNLVQEIDCDLCIVPLSEREIDPAELARYGPVVFTLPRLSTPPA